jgi:DNA-binding transcriptional LysR family regulator
MRQPDLEIDLLRTFVTVAESGSFTSAGEILCRTQSAVSQQVRRLEDIVGKSLFSRTSRAVTLNGDGEAFLAHAYAIIALNDAVLRHMKAPPVEGRLRLGVAEDFIPRQLPLLLSRFVKTYPQVQLDLMTGLSTMLVETLNSGGLDLVIAKRDAQPQAGRVIWREKLVWIASPEHMPEKNSPLPLVALPAPCAYRRIMLDVLLAVQRPWRIACIAHSITGLQAAVTGNMGLSVLGRSFLGPNLIEAPEALGLPQLPDTEIAVFGEEAARIEVADCLVTFVTEALEGLTLGGRSLPMEVIGQICACKALS